MTKATRSDIVNLKKGLDAITQNQKTRASVVNQFKLDINQGVSYVQAARAALEKAASTIVTGDSKLDAAYKAAQAGKLIMTKRRTQASPKKKPPTPSWATRLGTFVTADWTFRKVIGGFIGVLIGVFFVWGVNKILSATSGFFAGIDVIILILAFIGGVALGLWMLNRNEKPND